MFASNSGTEVGVVSNGELDGDDNSPVMVKTVQVGTEWAAGVVVVVVDRGSGAGIIIRVTTRVNVGRVSVASDRSWTKGARDNRRAAADLKCGRMAVMA